MTPVEVDETLQLLRDSVRGVLGRHWSPQRAERPGGDELEAMLRVAVEHGWTSLGGVGETGAWAVVLEETGRAACPLPLRDPAVAAIALDGDAPAAEYLGGDTARVALALAALGGERAAGSVGAETDGVSRPLRLHGVIRLVECANLATHALVETEGWPRTALVALDQPGVRITTAPSLGGSLDEISFDGAVGISLPLGPPALGAMERLARLGCLARARGAAQRSFELALEHAQARRQFGSPIGRFQAIQHRLADCATALDACRLLVDHAVAARDRGATWHRSADAAVAYGAPALRRVARDAQHVLAGVGYMEEHEAPRHFRRVFADTVRFGGGAAARDALAAPCLRPAPAA